ncbi:MAG: PilZ domain-containing protein [Pseudomonadales bacterium]|nr:PilZ domain-containing protein [Pseudomonadales bacterium]
MMASVQNKRLSIRTLLQVPVKIMHPVLGDVVVHTADISDGGLYFVCQNANQFNLQEEFKVQVMAFGEGDAPLVKMSVVRIENQGVGLKFM